MLYIALDPRKYPRIRKIAYTLRKYKVDFRVMIPIIRIEWGKSKVARLVSAIINYVLVLLQILFVQGDVLWVANCPDILAFPLVLRKRDYILDYRSPWSLEVEREFGKGALCYVSALIEDLVLRHAKVITLTTSKLVVRVSHLGKPVYVIPNYPTKNFRHTVPREDFRKLLGVKKDVKVVLFVGRLSRVEGTDLMQNIVPEVLKKVEAVFWIVGDGPLRSSVEKIEREYPEAVKLFGWQPYNRIPDFVNASDVCMVPRHESSYSHYYNEEGLQKISEYMVYKKPIVACGIAPSNEYLLVKEEQVHDGIIKAIKGEALLPTPKTWEGYSEGNVLKAVGVK